MLKKSEEIEKGKGCGEARESPASRCHPEVDFSLAVSGVTYSGDWLTKFNIKYGSDNHIVVGKQILKH